MDEQNPQPQSTNNNMKPIMAVIVIIILAVVGYALSKNKSSEQAKNSNTEMESMDMEHNNDQAEGMMMEDNHDQSMSASSSGSMMMSDATTKEFTVKGTNFSFTPSEIKVNKGDKVKITFENTGGFHDFVIEEFNVKTKQIASGASETVEFTADKAGAFEYYCSVGSHRQMGMKGSLIVQ